ncbi:MAG TPA: hypothetical protein VFS21_04565 [Roseiflexaceae bacterium]|nr:hypothetical protein [Roseiflexaceae bacterium]
MRRVMLLAAVLLLVLTACGGVADSNLGAPPQSQPLTQSDNAKVRQVLDEWRASVPEVLTNQGVKPETIVQETYTSTASLSDIATFYDQLTSKGWVKSTRLSSVQATSLENGVLLTGYDSGAISSFVVGAFDASKLGGEGVVVYTAKGNK